MATWKQFEDEAPDLAAAIRARLESTKHHVLATLRRDGSPRVSGTEVQFHADELMAGSMFGSVKAKDLAHEPRFALHANPGDGSMEGGDAKLSGRAREVVHDAELASYVAAVKPPEPFQLFAFDLEEAVLTSMHPAGDRIVVEWWRPGDGVKRVERS